MTDTDPCSQPTQLETFDVLIVGAASAGLYTDLCIAQPFQFGLMNQDNLTLSASDWALGETSSTAIQGGNHLPSNS